MPLSAGRHLPWGCVFSACVLLLICWALFASTGWTPLLVAAIPLAVGLLYAAVRYAYGLVLLVLVESRWTRKGLKCLIVYSDSPLWASYIQREWLPRLGPVSVQLNWSQRATWRSSLEARIFWRFCHRETNFNPAIVVFDALAAPRVYRFYYAFRQFSQGRPQYLQELEHAVFNDLEGAAGGRTRG